MARRKKKATKRKTSKKAPAPMREAPKSKPKKEATDMELRYKKIRHILGVLGREVAAAEEATRGRKHEHLNAAIVGSETLWQNLRSLAREI